MVKFPIKNPFTIKKKVGTIRRREIEYTVVPYKMVSPRATLWKLSEQLAAEIGAYEGRIKKILDHTHTGSIIKRGGWQVLQYYRAQHRRCLPIPYFLPTARAASSAKKQKD